MTVGGTRALVLLATVAAVLGTACARSRVATLPPGPAPPGWEETGIASWYGHPYHGRRAASGEIYDMHQLTAAHRTLPFDTWLLVENRLNARTVEVRVTDRGPFVDDRVLDLSYAAARLLDAIGPGTIPVRLRVIAGPAGAAGSGSPPDGAPASDPPEPAPTRRFTVQVGAFTDASRAIALRSALEQEGSAARIRRAETAIGLLYRVRVGSFASRAEAQQAAERLAGAGHPVVVTVE